MPDNNGKKNSKNGKIWTTVVGVGVAFTLIFGFIAYDDRLAKCDEVKQGLQQVEEKVCERIAQLELETVQTMKEFQKGQQYQQYDYLDEALTRDYNSCLNELAREPNNTMVKQRCDDIRAQHQRIKQKKEELYNF